MKTSIHDYNYQHFNPKDYNFTTFPGPKPGEKYINFEATTLEGDKVHLSDYLDKPVILETGSITCPIYANASKPMLKLKEMYPELNFLLLYIREAHPGSKTPAQQTMEEKLENAKQMQQLYNETRTILVDDIQGTAHQLYGSMPNMVYVIDRDGTVLFRANWNDFDKIKEVLATVPEHKVYTRDRYEIIKPNPVTAIRTLLIGGWDAFIDFFKNLPQLMAQHKAAKEAQSTEY